MSKSRMRTLILVGSTCAALAAGVAHGQSGVDLSWNDCPGSGHDAFNLTVPCANTGLFNLLCSFASPQDIADLAGVEWYLDIHVSAGTASAWWSQPDRFTTDLLNLARASCGKELWNLSPDPSLALGNVVTTIGSGTIRVRNQWTFAAGRSNRFKPEPVLQPHLPAAILDRNCR